MIGENATVRDARSLVDAILATNSRFQGQVWWRGQGQHGWDLEPSVFRPRDGGHRYEQNVILRFRQRAPSRHANVPTDSDMFGWLFLMQHYRLPTRLLDWTESPLFACYFAVEDLDHANEDGALYALNPYLLNLDQAATNGLLMPNSPICRRAVVRSFKTDADDVDYVVGVLPSETQMRMMVQLSVFTVHGSGRKLNELPAASEYLVKYRIPSPAKALLQSELKYLGVRASNLFPDLEHLAKETRELKFIAPRLPQDGQASVDGGPGAIESPDDATTST